MVPCLDVAAARRLALVAEATVDAYREHAEEEREERRDNVPDSRRDEQVAVAVVFFVGCERHDGRDGSKAGDRQVDEQRVAEEQGRRAVVRAAAQVAAEAARLVAALLQLVAPVPERCTYDVG